MSVNLHFWCKVKAEKAFVGLKLLHIGVGGQTFLLYASPMWHMGPGPILYIEPGIGLVLFSTYSNS